MIQLLKSSKKKMFFQGINILSFNLVLAVSFLSVNAFGQPAQNVIRDSGSTLLKEFEGFYQLPNRVAFLEIKLRENSLFATKMWDQKSFELVQSDESTFESKNEGYKIEFVKDDSGHVNGGKILGRIPIRRVEFNPNTVVSLTKAEFEQLSGTYELKDKDNMKIQISPNSSALTLRQLWDNKTITFTPRSNTFFLNSDGTFPLTFTLTDGKVDQVICFENDVWLKVNSAAQ